MSALGRLKPTDWNHVEKYPYAAVADVVAFTVERTIPLPWWHWSHDQGREGSCVGHGSAMERAITNLKQNREAQVQNPTRRYGPISLWNDAKVVDEWPDTNPGDDNGTSVRAAYDVLRDKGAAPVKSVKLDADGDPVEVGLKPYDLAEGVSANRWATTVDEMRLAIKDGKAITIGVDWYLNFDKPVKVGTQWWIGRTGWDSTRIRGGHSTCIYGASDRRQAFRMKNSWGRAYPLVWLTYAAMERLLRDEGEAALATDR